MCPGAQKAALAAGVAADLVMSKGLALSTHSINTPYRHTLSMHPIGTPYQPPLSQYPIITPLTHPFNTMYPIPSITWWSDEHMLWGAVRKGFDPTHLCYGSSYWGIINTIHPSNTPTYTRINTTFIDLNTYSLLFMYYIYHHNRCHR